MKIMFIFQILKDGISYHFPDVHTYTLPLHCKHTCKHTHTYKTIFHFSLSNINHEHQPKHSVHMYSVLHVKLQNNTNLTMIYHSQTWLDVNSKNVFPRNTAHSNYQRMKQTEIKPANVMI